MVGPPYTAWRKDWINFDAGTSGTSSTTMDCGTAGTAAGWYQSQPHVFSGLGQQAQDAKNQRLNELMDRVKSNHIPICNSITFHRVNEPVTVPARDIDSMGPIDQLRMRVAEWLN